MLLLCSRLAWMTIAVGVFFTCAKTQKEGSGVFLKTPNGFNGKRLQIVCAEIDVVKKKKTLSKVTSAVHLKGSSMNALRLYCSNAARLRE